MGPVLIGLVALTTLLSAGPPGQIQVQRAAPPDFLGGTRVVFVGTTFT